MRGAEHERTAQNWAPWFGPVALLVAFGATLVVAAGLTIADSRGDEELDAGPFTTIVATLAQDTLLVLVAVGLALQRGRPVLADFGWRPQPAKRSILVFVGGVVAFYGAAGTYQAIVDQPGDQNVLEALGADRGGAYLLLSAAIVVILAPITEETFFRGFLYRSLRNRLGAGLSVAVVALVFGAIHYSGPDTVALLPVLALLGAIFCLMYELSGSILPAVALHTINNGIAFAATAPSSDAEARAGIAALATVAVCMSLMRSTRRAT